MSNKILIVLLATFHLASPFILCPKGCFQTDPSYDHDVIIQKHSIRLFTFTKPTLSVTVTRSLGSGIFFNGNAKFPGIGGNPTEPNYGTTNFGQSGSTFTPSATNNFPATTYKPITTNIPVTSSVPETSNIPETTNFEGTNNIAETTEGPFSSALFEQISSQNENENVIVSPFSIQTALTLLYMGAEGKTAEELRTALRYRSAGNLQIAQNISHILNSKSDGVVQLKIANKIYSGYELDPEFNKIASQYFKSEAEKVDFGDSKATVNKINSWVEKNTDNKITDLLSPDSVDKETTAILVNAIYFKAQWYDQFSKYATTKRPFWLSATKSIDVDTMFGEITCKYGDFPEYDATAVELKYEDNDMALLLVLPNKRQGLKELEKKLSTVDLKQLSLKMSEEDVEVKLPKFKIEFNTQLVPILQKLGMQKAFSYDADYSRLFESSLPVKVSDVVHKAFIEVNEYGSEAAASTYVKTVYLSSISNPKIFTVDHPFVFAIKNNEAVYFAGHVVKL